MQAIMAASRLALVRDAAEKDWKEWVRDLLYELVVFIDSIGKGKEAVPSGQDAINVLKVIKKVYG